MNNLNTNKKKFLIISIVFHLIVIGVILIFLFLKPQKSKEKIVIQEIELFKPEEIQPKEQKEEKPAPKKKKRTAPKPMKSQLKNKIIEKLDNIEKKKYQ